MEARSLTRISAVRFGKLNRDQRKLFKATSVYYKDRLSVNLLFHRSRLWVDGSIADIKPGKYIAGCRQIEHDEKIDPETFDCFSQWEEVDMDWQKETSKAGFARGLADNVHLRAGNAHVLLMDNHRFAAAFIFEMFNAGIIKKDSSMTHIDAHDDCGYSQGDFTVEQYFRFKSDRERLEYLLENVDDGDWQRMPLFVSGLVNRGNWHWLGIDEWSREWFRDRKSVV